MQRARTDRTALITDKNSMSASNTAHEPVASIAPHIHSDHHQETKRERKDGAFRVMLRVVLLYFPFLHICFAMLSPLFTHAPLLFPYRPRTTPLSGQPGMDRNAQTAPASY